MNTTLIARCTALCLAATVTLAMLGSVNLLATPTAAEANWAQRIAPAVQA